jgi:hypothetical protein
VGVGDACPPLSSKVRGKAGLERCGAARLGRVRCSKARQVWLVKVRLGIVRFGSVRQVGHGPIRPGKVGFSKAGVVRRGSVCHDPAR